MLHPRLVLLGCAILAASDAFIEFEKSRLYDEKDFEGNVTIHLEQYCNLDCQMYVSVPEDSVGVAKLIYTTGVGGKQTSLYDTISRQSNGRLRPYYIQKYDELINENEGGKSAPMAVWILQHDAENINSAEVYDGSGAYLDAKPAKGFRTFLCAEPFELHTARLGTILSYTGITAGFDAFSSADSCTKVVHVDGETARTKNLYVELIRSPLFTLKVDATPDTNLMISTSNFKRDDSLLTQVSDQVPSRKGKFDMERALFFTSPGYIGCAVKEGENRTKSFRSTLHPTKGAYYASMFDKEKIHFTMHYYINVNRDNAVEVTTNGATTRWWSTNTPPSERQLAKDLKILWTRDASDPDQYFMIRLTSSATHGFSLLLSVVFCIFIANY